MAPECLVKRNGRYLKPTFKSDIWSFGALLIELFTAEELFVDLPQLRSWKPIGKMPPTFDKLPSLVQGIIESCLSLKPEDRPTASDLVSFFHNYAALPTDELNTFN